MMVQIIFLYCFLISLANCFDFDQLNIPQLHIPFFFTNNPHLKDLCLNSSSCPYYVYAKETGCWGYEENCTKDHVYSIPSCPGDYGAWAKSKQEQIDLFFTQGDFGYIKEKKKEMEMICAPNHPEDTSLECVHHLRYCRSKNILINFENLLTIEQPMRYRMDVLKYGQIGGSCKLNVPLLEKRLDHKSPLQSWAPELRNFVKFAYRPIADKKCDVVIDKPTFVMKLDATVNMYHHFCDFLNLYISQHMNNSFSQDVYILIWDMMPYHSNFGYTWKAFTKHPVLDLEKFAGKRICFQDLIFTYLPRMIFGMYYNMPLVTGCEKSGLFHAFTHHVLYRLNINQNLRKDRKLRVTLLSRGTTYRKILNEDELIAAMQKEGDFEVQKIDFNHQMPFAEQLQITHNTDIFIGIHGAGLTHSLFLPDWAVVMEIYNCEDEACYRDLAFLRGVHYMTWENEKTVFPEDEGHHPTMGAHAKFTNYAFDVTEFLRLIKKAKNRIHQNPKWPHYRVNHDEL